MLGMARGSPGKWSRRTWWAPSAKCEQLIAHPVIRTNAFSTGSPALTIRTPRRTRMGFACSCSRNARSSAVIWNRRRTRSTNAAIAQLPSRLAGNKNHQAELCCRSVSLNGAVEPEEAPMRRVLKLALTAAIVTAWSAVPAVTLAPSPAAAQTVVPASVSDLRAAMRKLWEDHITWTRVYIIDALAGLPDTNAAAARLLRNQDDIGAAIVPYYGAAAGTQLTGLLKQHIMIATEVLKA